MKLPISLVVLTYNEEKNIEDCLQSVKDWVEEIIILDSYSTDRTLEIAQKYTSKIFQHPFENYAYQRNWALENLHLNYEWVMNLDADNRVSNELREELFKVFQDNLVINYKGFLASRRTIFLSKWIRYGGHYPTYHAFLFRKGFGFCENKLYDQHFVVNGEVKVLKGDIIDVLTDSITKFIERHNHWATLEANEQVIIKRINTNEVVNANLSGNPIEKRRALKNYYNRFPLFIRPFIYFFIRYILKFGFLDGRTGLIFHFLQGFWFRFLVDAKIYEKRKSLKKTS